LGLQSTRTAVQAYQIKQNFLSNNASLRWVAADWNLADGFTKEAAESRANLESFLKLQTWRIQFSADFIVSARRAKRLGKSAIEVMNDDSAEPEPEFPVPMPHNAHLASDDYFFT